MVAIDGMGMVGVEVVEEYMVIKVQLREVMRPLLVLSLIHI